LSDNRIGGVLDTWLSPLKAVRRVHEEELMAIEDEAKRAVRLAELNVETGVQHLLSNFNVAEAVETRDLQVHGVVYDIASGKIYDLNVCTQAGSKGKSSANAGVAGQADGQVVRGNHGMLVFSQGEGAAMAIR
jgi:carbonic anhydrase